MESNSIETAMLDSSFPSSVGWMPDVDEFSPSSAALQSFTATSLQGEDASLLPSAIFPDNHFMPQDGNAQFQFGNLHQLHQRHRHHGTEQTVPMPSTLSLSQINPPSRRETYAFLHSRPLTACSHVATKITRGRRSVSVSEGSSISTPRTRQVTLPDVMHDNFPFSSPCSASQQASPAKVTAAGKKRSSSHRARVALSPTAPSVSARSNKTTASPFGNVTSLPMRLARPPLMLISDPRKDLVDHLHRHGLHEDAENFASAPGITVDFVLRTWVLSVATSGPISLLNVSSTFLDDFKEHILGQLSEAKQFQHGLPRKFVLPPDVAMRAQQEAPATLPTHILAVHGTNGNEKGYLVPCHALLYVLQCVSLPMINNTRAGQNDEDHFNETSESYDLPVVPICVPRPKFFAVLHRFIYTHDTSALLMEILPIRFIARYCEQQVSMTAKKDVMAGLHFGSCASRLDGGLDQPEQPLFRPSTPTKTLPEHVVDALAHLGTPNLFTIAYKVHSLWANGVAVGLTEPTFWKTLDHAWSLVVAALGTKKGRLLDAEQRGLNLSLKGHE